MLSRQPTVHPCGTPSGGDQDASSWGIKEEGEASIYRQADMKETQLKISSVLQDNMIL